MNLKEAQTGYEQSVEDYFPLGGKLLRRNSFPPFRKLARKPSSQNHQLYYDVASPYEPFDASLAPTDGRFFRTIRSSRMHPPVMWTPRVSFLFVFRRGGGL